MNLNPKALEAWFTLMAQAMRGTQEAQDALRSLSEISSSTEDLMQWMTKFMPAAVPSGTKLRPEALEGQLEEWWRMMGVVPRTRYLELLERFDTLQRRLDKAEKTVHTLRAALDNKGQHTEEAKQALDMWSTMMQDTLQTQTEWMQAWMTPSQQSGSGAEDQENLAADESDTA